MERLSQRGYWLDDAYVHILVTRVVAQHLEQIYRKDSLARAGHTLDDYRLSFVYAVSDGSHDLVEGDALIGVEPLEGRVLKDLGLLDVGDGVVCQLEGPQLFPQVFEHSRVNALVEIVRVRHALVFVSELIATVRMHIADKTVLVIGDNRAVEFLVVDDVDRIEVAFFLVGAVLVHAGRDAGCLANIRSVLVCKDVDHGPVENLVVGEGEPRDVDPLARQKWDPVHVEGRTFRLLRAIGRRYGDHSSVYFSRVAAGLVRGVLAAVVVCSLSLTALARSMPSASAMYMQYMATSASSSLARSALAGTSRSDPDHWNTFKQLGGLEADRYRQVLRIVELRPIPLVSECNGLLGRIFECHSRSSHSPLAPNRGLYVSAGGFTKEARHEADCADVPIRLIDLDSFVRTYV